MEIAPEPVDCGVESSLGARVMTSGIADTYHYSMRPLSQCLPTPHWAMANLCFPRKPSNTCRLVQPGSYWALYWVLMYVKSSVCPPRVEFLFLPVLWSSCTQVLLTFKSKCSWDSSSQWQSLWLGSVIQGSKLSLLCENLCDIIIFQLLGYPPNTYEIWLCHESTPPTISFWPLLFVWM